MSFDFFLIIIFGLTCFFIIVLFTYLALKGNETKIALKGNETKNEVIKQCIRGDNEGKRGCKYVVRVRYGDNFSAHTFDQYSQKKAKEFFNDVISQLKHSDRFSNEFLLIFRNKITAVEFYSEWEET